jgi:hypothetical protein
MNAALELPFLSAVPRVWFYIAISAWTLALIGLGHRLLAPLIRARSG